MTTSSVGLHEQFLGLTAEQTARLATLQKTFDDSFARPARAVDAPRVELVGMRIQGDAYALRVDELAGVYAQKRIVPFPSPVPELLGLAAVRTAIVPVYDVSALLGYRGDEVPRWFALTRGARPVGLAFTEFDGSLRPRRDELVPVEGEDLKRRHLVASVRIDDELRFIVRIPSLLEQLQKHTAREDP